MCATKLRREHERFFEVYVKCPSTRLVERDVKGLYKKAIAGEIAHFTGISDPYEEPHQSRTGDRQRQRDRRAKPAKADSGASRRWTSLNPAGGRDEFGCATMRSPRTAAASSMTCRRRPPSAPRSSRMRKNSRREARRARTRRPRDARLGRVHPAHRLHGRGRLHAQPRRRCASLPACRGRFRSRSASTRIPRARSSPAPISRSPARTGCASR